MIANSNAKTTRRVALTGAAIAAVTLALVAAAIVSMMSVQTAHAGCIVSPDHRTKACSGSFSTTCGINSGSCSIGPCGAAVSGSSGSASICVHNGLHTSFSGSIGHGHCADTTCSGKK